MAAVSGAGRHEAAGAVASLAGRHTGAEDQTTRSSTCPAEIESGTRPLHSALALYDTSQWEVAAEDWALPGQRLAGCKVRA